MQQALPDRPVEPHRRGELRDRLRRRARPEQHLRGVARDEQGQREEQDGCAEQNQDRRRDPVEQEPRNPHLKRLRADRDRAERDVARVAARDETQIGSILHGTDLTGGEPVEQHVVAIRQQRGLHPVAEGEDVALMGEPDEGG